MCEQRLTNTAERLLELLKRAQATKDRDAEFEILIRLRKIGHAAPEYEAKAVLRFVPKAGVDAEEQLMKLLPSAVSFQTSSGTRRVISFSKCVQRIRNTLQSMQITG
jgi:hypothetical protein